MKSQKNKKYKIKSIKVSIKNGDDTKVKVEFHGGAFKPDEFTSMIMALLESYTAGLLETNSKEAIFEHFNNVFGIYLRKLVPEQKVYQLSPSHADFHKVVEGTLEQPLTEEIKKENEDNRLAAFLLAREILIEDAGLDETSADILLNKRLNNFEYEEKKEG